MSDRTEIDARENLDAAIRAYSAVFDRSGTVNAWALVYERSALFPDDEHEPLRYALSYVSSIGTSSATASGLLRAGTDLTNGMASASFYPAENDE